MYTPRTTNLILERKTVFLYRRRIEIEKYFYIHHHGLVGCIATRISRLYSAVFLLLRLFFLRTYAVTSSILNVGISIILFGYIQIDHRVYRYSEPWVFFFFH